MAGKNYFNLSEEPPGSFFEVLKLRAQYADPRPIWMHFTCSTSVHRISFDIKDIHQKSQLSKITKTIVPEEPFSCIIAPWQLVLINSKTTGWGVLKSPLRREKCMLYLVTVWDQEGGVVSSDGAPKLPNAWYIGPKGGPQGSKWPKMKKSPFSMKPFKIIDEFNQHCPVWTRWAKGT